MMIPLEKLHDATLIGLKVDWASGEVQILFKLSASASPDARLIANAMTRLVCPRQYPWGRSVSINNVRAERLPDGVLLTLEMQSGDVIEVNAADFALD